MMARSRNLPLLLGVLLLALGALFVSQGGLGGLSGSLVPGTAPGVASVAAPVGVPEAVRSPTYPSVNLEALASVRATPASEARNPFSLDAPGHTASARVAEGAAHRADAAHTVRGSDDTASRQATAEAQVHRDRQPSG